MKSLPSEIGQSWAFADYQWDTPLDREPEVWFHDIRRADGNPFESEEAKYFKKIPGKLREELPRSSFALLG